MSERPNPYVGPSAFKIGQAIYGRDSEIRQLFQLLVAERIVLLHSPSGAGKSSLVQAGLIPRLQDEGFRVLPVARVNLERPLDLLSPEESSSTSERFNRYIFSTLLSLDEGLPLEQRTAAVHLAQATLEGYLGAQIEKFSGQQDGKTGIISTVLIFDQFEEILTTAPTDREGKQAFFQQLGQTLRNPQLWGLFSIREDYLGALEPYTRPIPTRLANTFRLDLLSAAAARQAIQKPARNAKPPVDFTDTAAQKLVDDLRRIQVQQPDGSTALELGPNVEPVQLQVVCYRLWENLALGQAKITPDDLDKVGDVNESLADYYCQSVANAAEKAGIPERLVREWFEHQLITSGLRSQVRLEEKVTAGIPNTVIDFLRAAYLVRAEQRAGSTWFELAHDRLIKPVLENNAGWFQANLSPLQRQADNWERSKRPDNLLLRGQELAVGLEWANSHTQELTPIENDFLRASGEVEEQAQAMQRLESERQRAEEKARSAARLRVLLIVAVIAALAALVFGGIAANQSNLASKQKTTAEAASTLAVGNAYTAATALVEAQKRGTQLAEQAAIVDAARIAADNARLTATAALGTAVVDRQIAITQEAIAVVLSNQEATQRSIAESNARLATSRQLAAQGQGYLITDPRLAYLLGVEAEKELDTWEARNLLLTSLQQSQEQGVETFGTLPGPQGTFIYSVALNPQKTWIAWADKDGRVTIWDYEQGEIVWMWRGSADGRQTGHTDGVWGLDFSPDGKMLASSSMDQTIILWDMDTGQGQTVKLNGPTGWDVSFSPRGDQLAVAGDSRVRIYNLNDLSAEVKTPNRMTHDKFINNLSWSPNGRWVASTGEDGKVKVWDPKTGSAVQNFTMGGKVVGIDWSPDSRILAAGNTLHDLYVWSSEPWKELKRLVHDESPDNSFDTVIFDVAFLSNQLMASAGNDNRIILWNTDTFAQVDVLNLGEGQLRSLDALPDREPPLLASGGTDEIVRLFQVKSQNPLNETVDNLDGQNPIIGLRLPPGGTSIVSVENMGNAAHIRKDRQATQPDIPGAFSSAALSQDGEKIALGSQTGEIEISEIGAKNSQTPIQAADTPILSLAFNQDDSKLASAACAFTVENRAGQPLCSQGIIRIWGAGQQENRIKTEGYITALAYHPQEKWLAAAVGREIRLFDLATGQPLSLSFLGHTAPVTSLAVSPDGLLLASSDQDNALILWDTRSGQPIGAPFKTSQAITSLAFDPSGQYLSTGSTNGTIERWLVGVDGWIERICGLIGQDRLGPGELARFLPNLTEDPQKYQTCP